MQHKYIKHVHYYIQKPSRYMYNHTRIRIRHKETAWTNGPIPLFRLFTKAFIWSFQFIFWIYCYKNLMFIMQWGLNIYFVCFGNYWPTGICTVANLPWGCLSINALLIFTTIEYRGGNKFHVQNLHTSVVFLLSRYSAISCICPHSTVRYKILEGEYFGEFGELQEIRQNFLVQNFLL